MPLFVDEVLIERYIRHPQILSVRERSRLAHLLSLHPPARIVASLLADFHERLDVIADEVPPQVDRFGEALFQRNRFFSDVL